MAVFKRNGKTVVVSTYATRKSFKFTLVYFDQELEGSIIPDICACRPASNCSSSERAAKMINEFLGAEVAEGSLYSIVEKNVK